MYHCRTVTVSCTLVILMLTMIPAFAHVPVGHANKPQPPPTSTGTAWAKAYNIPYSYSVAASVSQTASGGYVVGGSCTGGVTSSACADVSEPAAIVMMLDPNGNIQSQTQYLYKNYPYSTPSGLIRPTSDGGATFAGNAQFGCPATGQTSCATIVRVDSTGRVQWANDLQFSTSSSYGPLTWPLDLQTTSDGGTVVTGYAFAPGASYNPFVAKLSSTGQVQWQHVYVDPNSGYSYAVGVRQTPDGGYAVAGEVSYTITSSYTESDIAVFKLDSTGNLIWQHSYLVGTDSYAESLALTSDGGFIVGGLVSINTSTSYSSAVLLLKLDSLGNALFAKTYVPTGSISDLTIAEVQQTTDGGYAFAGHYFENTIYDQRAWLVKTDSAGNVQWNKIYGAEVQYSARTFNSFQQTSDGGFIAAGSTNQYNNGYTSLWLVKTDSNGNIGGCNDVHSASDTSSSAMVKVSSMDLAASKDSFSYLADTLAVFTGPFIATKEC